MSIPNALNTKARAFVVFLFSVITFGIFVLSSLLATMICRSWYGLAVGFGLMIIAIPFHWIGKKHPWGYLLSIFFNAVGNGCSVSAYYLSKEIPLNLSSLLLGTLPALGILLLTAVILHSFPRTKRVTLTITCLLNTFLIVYNIVRWLMENTVFTSFGFFCLLLSFFFLCVFGITINHEERSVLRDISFGVFGSFIILSLAVIVILSEGDVLEGVDPSGTDDTEEKKKKEEVPS